MADTVVLSTGKISQGWSWLNISTAVTDWLSENGYGGGYVPLGWWGAEDLGQDCFLLTGQGSGRPFARETPVATVEDGKIQSVKGQILCRMYDGKYRSWTSDKRHGQPIDVKVDANHTAPASWIAIQATDILPLGGSSHGIEQ